MTAAADIAQFAGQAQLAQAQAAQQDLVAQKRAMDQTRHEIQGGDAGAAKRKDAKLKEACQGFEAIFLNQIWTKMRQNVPKSGYLHSKEEETWQQMMDKAMVEKMSKDGGVGLGDMLYKHLKESTERVSRHTSPTKGQAPLPLALDPADRLRLGQELAQADAERVKPLTQAMAGQGGPLQQGPALAQVAYAPYVDSDADPAAAPAAAPVDDAAAASPSGELVETRPLAVANTLSSPGIKPLPAPAIDPPPASDKIAQKPAEAPLAAPAAKAATPGSAEVFDARELNPLDVAALAQAEKLAASLTADSSAAPGSQGPGANAQQIQQAQQALAAYEKTAKTANAAKSDGRRSSMPPLSMPVAGETVSGFGWRTDPVTGQKAWHAGVDVKAPEGTPVNACWDGTVIFSGNKGEYGNIVVVEHAGGWRSFYGHAADITAKPGQKIKAGEQIATVGQTGRATGPHLHFELRQAGLAWDPEQVREHLAQGLEPGKKS